MVRKKSNIISSKLNCNHKIRNHASFFLSMKNRLKQKHCYSIQSWILTLLRKQSEISFKYTYLELWVWVSKEYPSYREDEEIDKCGFVNIFMCSRLGMTWFLLLLK